MIIYGMGGGFGGGDWEDELALADDLPGRLSWHDLHATQIAISTKLKIFSG